MIDASFPKYKRYKDSGIEWLGDVPKHWEVQSLRAIAGLYVEKNQPDLPVLSVYREYGVILKDSRDDNHNATSLDTSNYKVVRPGDLAVNKMKAWQGSLGVSEHHGIVSPAYITCRLNQEKVTGRYIHYLLRSKSLIGALDSISYGVRVGQWDMRFEDFKKVGITIPPKPEQDSIVAFLDQKTAEIDALIAKKQRQIELLDEQKAILINRAVTRGIVNSEFGMRNDHLSSSSFSHSTFTTHNSKFKPSGIEWIGKIPEHWEVKRIGHLGAVGNGSTPSRSNPRYWDRIDYPWLNSGSVNQGVITEADQFVSNLALKECHLPLVKENSIVIAITGQGKTRGTAALLTIQATINQHLAYIEIQTPAALPKFIHLALTSQYLQLRAISESGSTKGALTCQDVKEFKIVLPPIEEQKAIISASDNLQKDYALLASQFDSQIQSLKALRSTLIAHAVTGRIKV